MFSVDTKEDHSPFEVSAPGKVSASLEVHFVVLLFCFVVWERIVSLRQQCVVREEGW